MSRICEKYIVVRPVTGLAVNYLVGWVHRRVICWGLEPGFPLSLILHKYLLLIQTILLNLIKGLLIMIKSRAFIFSLFFHPFRESDVLPWPAPKRRFFLRYWVCGIQFSIANRNLSLQVMLYDPLCWRTTEELYQPVRQFSGYFTTRLYFYKYHVQRSVSVAQ